MSLHFILGTRPEIIKLAPILRRVVAKGIPSRIIHTHQHFDHIMDTIFFEELGLPKPYYHLNVRSGTSEGMVANVIEGCTNIWNTSIPSIVIVQGDTNTTLGASLAAAAMHLPIAHIEAGLRSDDWSMPEELNRIAVDHLSERLYVPTSLQADRLVQEEISEDRLLVSGNTILDAVQEHIKLAEKYDLPSTFTFPSKSYALITLHRPALVDDSAMLSQILQDLNNACDALHLRGIFLVHPRTKKSLCDIERLHSISCVDPVGYLQMLKLLMNAKCIFTDSGGLQEEAAILHVPCITLRANTERPETLLAGGNILIPPQSKSITEDSIAFLQQPKKWQPLYKESHPSDMILQDLSARYL